MDGVSKSENWRTKRRAALTQVKKNRIKQEVGYVSKRSKKVKSAITAILKARKKVGKKGTSGAFTIKPIWPPRVFNAL